MASRAFFSWAADGKPSQNCQPINDLIASLRRHGYSGPGNGLGDESHLTAEPPQDHTPYSATPWPGTQPYPYVMAIDIMPDPAVDWQVVGQNMVRDRIAGAAGTAPFKYINWTDPATGQIWQDSWTPTHRRVASSDGGHVHVSFRTDYVTSTIMRGYDPMAITQADVDLIVAGVFNKMVDAVSLGYNAPFAEYVKYIKQNSADITTLAEKLDDILELLGEGGGGGGVTVEEVQDMINGTLDQSKIVPPGS